MSFATPIALALAAVAIPIVIFYILKVRLRRVPVSTNLFWKQIYDEKPPRSIWQYLRHLLSLLAQLFLVALLVLAVADPSFSWQLLQARRIVAVIDNSASMRAADVQPSRFEAAIEAALATAEGLRFRDEMAIVLAGPEPEVVIGMSGHVPTLKRALRSIKISDNPTQLDSAIALGQQLIGEHPHGEILVFTDGCTQNSSLLPPPSSLTYRVFGSTEAGNIGITQFQVRRSLIDPLGYEVLAVVKNASSQAVKGRLELELSGIPVDVLPLDLPPDGVFSRTLEKTSLEGGLLVAKLTEIGAAEDADESATNDKADQAEFNALATDDQAWAVLPPREVQDVLIVTPGNLFLQKVFEANPLVRVTIEKDFPAAWPNNSIIVLHQNVPDKLPNGDLFIVDPLNSCDAWEVGESLANPIITEQDKDSPLMTHVRLDNVLMPEAKQLKFAELPHVLAGSLSGEAVYAEVKRSGGKCLVLSVDINEGDLAFRTAFPIMVTNLLGWFAGQTGELRESLATGSMTEVDVADAELPSTGACQLLSPAGESQMLSARGLKDAPHLAIPPLHECGIWRITNGSADDAEPLMELAVNLANDAETDLRTPRELLKEEPQTVLAGWFTRPIWFYLVAVACLVTVSEWWLYQRRVIT
ncbi:MAG: VWA domain-containing protein [Planctomycetota bacterium]|nr:VWA domain-containing protein [Planctomycetota bacterium]